MDDRGRKAFFPKVPADLVCDYDRTVFTAGTTDGNGDVMAALFDKSGDQEGKHVSHLGQELIGSFLAEDIPPDLPARSGKRPSP